MCLDPDACDGVSIVTMVVGPYDEVGRQALKAVLAYFGKCQGLECCSHPIRGMGVGDPSK